MSYVNQFEKREVGQKIRAIREANKMSHGDFAKAFGVNVKLVREWEKGVNLPNPKKLDKILNFKPNKKPASKPQEKKKTASNPIGKKKVHIVTEKQMEAIRQEQSELAFARVFSVMLSLPILALAEEGYGKKRLNRFIDRTLLLLREVEQGRMNIWEVNQEIKEKYGIDISVSDDLQIERKGEKEVFA